MIFRRLWQSSLFQELASKIFICSVDNEAVLKTLFKLKDDELKFSNAIRVAQEAAKVAKEQSPEKKTACFRCGNSGHFSKACPHIKAICSFCKKTGHLQSVCMSRLRDNSKLVILVHTRCLKLVAEPVTHFAVKRRGKRWVQFNIKLQKVARYPSWDNSNQPQVLMENHLT